MSKLTQVLATAAIAALGFATLTSAQAQEATPDYPLAVTSTLSRAQVQAELAQAKRDGSTRVWSTSYNHIAAAKSLKSRRGVTVGERRGFQRCGGISVDAFAHCRNPDRFRCRHGSTVRHDRCQAAVHELKHGCAVGLG